MENEQEKEFSQEPMQPIENTSSTEENQDISFNSRIPLDELKAAVTQLKDNLSKVIVGQKDFVELLIVGLLADGHVLIEGVPGIAKTVTAKLFAKSIETEFSRIQFTPDLMPSDVLGTSILNVNSSEFEFKPGPIFSNIVLIDEINRAPAKTQAALFEVMEERQVTIDGKEHKMQPPFMVLATQNPVEQEGTYALPEAQLDRFIFKIKVDYPSVEEEVMILQSHHERKQKNPTDLIEAVITPALLNKYRTQIHEIVIEEKIINYIAGSPRASLAIMTAAKAFAAINGRDFVPPEDVQKSLNPVLGHRIILTPDKEMEGMSTENVIEMIVKSIEIPR